MLSWTGSQNEPPDIIIKGGEAVEVKNIQSNHPRLQLNSSLPKQKIHSSNERVHNDAKTGWEEKDLVYIVGSKVKGGSVGFIWVFFGDCWCASKEVYQSLDEQIGQGMKRVEENPLFAELQETNEVGRFNNVDKHSRSHLRVRGMWTMEHPGKYFGGFIDSYKKLYTDKTPCFFVAKKEKYTSWSEEKRSDFESHPNINLTEAEVPDPDGDEMIRVIIVDVI